MLSLPPYCLDQITDQSVKTVTISSSPSLLTSKANAFLTVLVVSVTINCHGQESTSAPVRVVFLSFLFCITPAGLNLSIPSPPIPLFKVPGIFGLPSSS